MDCLGQIGIAESAISDRVPANEIAQHKQHFFREADRTGTIIDYQGAVAGSLKLVPTGARLSVLEEDYIKMIEAGLYQSEVALFSELMDHLTVLQTRANATKR